MEYSEFPELAAGRLASPLTSLESGDDSRSKKLVPAATTDSPSPTDDAARLLPQLVGLLRRSGELMESNVKTMKAVRDALQPHATEEGDDADETAKEHTTKAWPTETEKTTMLFIKDRMKSTQVPASSEAIAQVESLRSDHGEQREKTTVQVRLVFLKIGDVATQTQQFEADVYLQARWLEPAMTHFPDEKIESLDFANCWHPKIRLMNIITLCNVPHRDKTWYTYSRDGPGEVPYVIQHRRVKAIFFENLELNYFPLDVQELTVEVSTEHSTDIVELVPDTDLPSGVSTENFTDSDEWDMYNHVEVTSDTAQLLFTPKPSIRSVLKFQIRVGRRYMFFLWNVVTIVLMINLLTFGVYSISPDMPQKRMAINVTLLLTTVAFKMAINTNLPRISYLTYLDLYVLAGLSHLCLEIIQNACVSIVAALGSAQSARYMDYSCIGLFGTALVVLHFVFWTSIQRTAMRRRRQLQAKDLQYQKDPFSLCNSMTPIVRVNEWSKSLSPPRSSSSQPAELSPNATTGNATTTNKAITNNSDKTSASEKDPLLRSKQRRSHDVMSEIDGDGIKVKILDNADSEAFNVNTMHLEFADHI